MLHPEGHRLALISRWHPSQRDVTVLQQSYDAFANKYVLLRRLEVSWTALLPCPLTPEWIDECCDAIGNESDS